MQDPPNPQPDRKGLTAAERELELALARLRPSRARLDRDRLIFDAGRLAERRRARPWLAAAAVLGLCVLVTAAAVPGLPVRERIVYVDRPVEVMVVAEAPPAPAATTRTAGGVSYLDVRRAMAEGVGADLSDMDPNASRADRPGLPTVFFGLFTNQTHEHEAEGKCQ
ncbi:MAG: hypothetical protein GX591_18465 [Planctomycetes bacterium]|nr:hypothetical protein [Planctomycetota bacterium]